MKKGFLIAICCLILIACNKDEKYGDSFSPLSFKWKQIGLDGLRINRLEFNEDKLFAITNDGLFVMDINTENEFSLVGLKGKNLLDIAILDNKQLLASYRKPDWTEAEIYESLDGGETWNIKEHNFGIRSYPEAVKDFYWDISNEILYATGYGVLAKSSDGGSVWETIWGDWALSGSSMIVEMNPNYNDDIWFGGQGGIENGYLINLKNETIKNQWFNLVPNPTVPKEIVFDKNFPQNIYVGWEGELNKTSDYGNTWITLIDRHEYSDFFFGIGVSDINPDLVFTGKWNKGLEFQALTLYYSQDGGDNWQEEIYPDEDNGGILDLKIISTEDQERLFLALDKGGIYEIIVDRKKR